MQMLQLAARRASTRHIFNALPAVRRAALSSDAPTTSKLAPAARATSSRTSIVSKTGQTIRPDELDNLLQKRLFVAPAFKPYRGLPGVESRGLYNYGPPGSELQDNVLEVWRKHFVLEEDMLKVNCPAITPHEVFKTSGHVEKFTDLMCRDKVTGEHYRADHLVKAALEKRLAKGESTDHDSVATRYRTMLANLDSYDHAELDKIIAELHIKSPNGSPLGPVSAANLMFETGIGPSGKTRGYLRPETAQGQILMFQELLRYANGAMPFASATIGTSYRNEISPSTGILRTREFLLAEIEHFMDPDAAKNHSRFGEVESIELPLLDRDLQSRGADAPSLVTIGDAVANSIVDNQTLGYFMARTHLFLIKIGVDPARVRYRQHLSKEMAHYATDCWDAEIQTSYGWIECVGLADRSAFDLTAHAERTGESLGARQLSGGGDYVVEYFPLLNRARLGQRFKKDSIRVQNAVSALSQSELARLAEDADNLAKTTIRVAGASDAIPDGMVALDTDVITGIERRVVKKNTTRTYHPNVIEPSFGIGRILHALTEHCVDRRPGEDRARMFMSFPPAVAPTKVLILPLQLNHPDFVPHARKLQRRLKDRDIPTHLDAGNSSIGKRYSRNDELGTPLAITVDFQSLEDRTLTLRDRDSTAQVRADEDTILDAAVAIATGRDTWEKVRSRLPSATASNVNAA